MAVKLIKTFVPLEQFDWENSLGRKCTYFVGQIYNVREGNQELSDQVDTWLSEGKVTVKDKPASRLVGNGVVA